MNNLIDNAGQRALAVARVHALLNTIVELQNQISATMLERPTAVHALDLVSADVFLGTAAGALAEAANRLARIRQ